MFAFTFVYVVFECTNVFCIWNIHKALYSKLSMVCPYKKFNASKVKLYFVVASIEILLAVVFCTKQDWNYISVNDRERLA